MREDHREGDYPPHHEPGGAGSRLRPGLCSERGAGGEGADGPQQQPRVWRAERLYRLPRPLGLAALAAAVVFAGCSPRAGNAPAEIPGALESRREIWAAIQPLAAQRGLDPLFVYALVRIESRFDPHAKRGENRGLLQIKPRAWKAVTDIPYETGVW